MKFFKKKPMKFIKIIQNINAAGCKIDKLYVPKEMLIEYKERVEKVLERKLSSTEPIDCYGVKILPKKDKNDVLNKKSSI